MKYDKRITNPMTIFTPFDIDRKDVADCVGTKGYLTDHIFMFRNLDNCFYGTLTGTILTGNSPFRATNEKGVAGYFCFFLQSM